MEPAMRTARPVTSVRTRKPAPGREGFADADGDFVFGGGDAFDDDGAAGEDAAADVAPRRPAVRGPVDVDSEPVGWGE
jgi:hypothetical protein